MKKLTGKIISLKNLQTANVEVVRRFQHPIFKKYLARSKKYACQIPSELDGKLELGQDVTIAETKPISKTKRFIVLAVNKK